MHFINLSIITLLYSNSKNASDNCYNPVMLKTNEVSLQSICDIYNTTFETCPTTHQLQAHLKQQHSYGADISLGEWHSKNECLILTLQSMGLRISQFYATISFFALSFVFQGMAGVYLKFKNTTDWSNDIATIRFIEYSLSASVMLCSISLLCGVIDFDRLISIMMLCAFTQYLGLMSELEMNKKGEVMSELERNKKGEGTSELGEVNGVEKPGNITHIVMYHLLAWCTMILSFYFILDAYNNFILPSYDQQWIIDLTVFGMLTLFASFGLVQTCKLVVYCFSTESGIECCGNICYFHAARPELNKNCVYYNEVAYTILSFISKSFLGWLVYSTVLADNDFFTCPIVKNNINIYQTEYHHM